MRAHLDTARGDEGHVAVTDAHGTLIAERHFSLARPNPGALLRAIDAILRRHGGRRALCAISVVPGPGMFSRVRLGVVTANALAWALGVPLFVRGRRVRVAKPEYGKPPNITLPSAT